MADGPLDQIAEQLYAELGQDRLTGYDRACILSALQSLSASLAASEQAREELRAERDMLMAQLQGCRGLRLEAEAERDALQKERDEWESRVRLYTYDADERDALIARAETAEAARADAESSLLSAEARGRAQGLKEALDICGNYELTEFAAKAIRSRVTEGA
jgi:hypothetical protein